MGRSPRAAECLRGDLSGPVCLKRAGERISQGRAFSTTPPTWRSTPTAISTSLIGVTTGSASSTPREDPHHQPDGRRPGDVEQWGQQSIDANPDMMKARRRVRESLADITVLLPDGGRFQSEDRRDHRRRQPAQPAADLSQGARLRRLPGEPVSAGRSCPFWLSFNKRARKRDGQLRSRRRLRGTHPLRWDRLCPLIPNQCPAADLLLSTDRGRVLAEFRDPVPSLSSTAGRSPISSSQRFTFGNSSISIFPCRPARGPGVADHVGDRVFAGGETPLAEQPGIMTPNMRWASLSKRRWRRKVPVAGAGERPPEIALFTHFGPLVGQLPMHPLGDVIFPARLGAARSVPLFSAR